MFGDAPVRRSGRVRASSYRILEFYETGYPQHVLHSDGSLDLDADLEEEQEQDEAPTSQSRAALLSPVPKTPSPKAAETVPQAPPAAAAAPATPATPAAAAATTTAIDYAEEDDTPLGAQFQVAAIPAWRPRPAQPTAAEARFLSAAPLYPPPAAASMPVEDAMDVAVSHGVAAVFKADYTSEPDAAVRRALLAHMLTVLDNEMAPGMAKVLHLDLLGFKCRSVWQPHEELLFCLGMCDKYRMFKYIRQCFLFSRSAHELNGYYHNVWKTRSTPEAETFLTLREQGAGYDALCAFADKVRDRLTAMWDRKVMGDMPKILRDAAEAGGAYAQPQLYRTNNSLDSTTTSSAAAAAASDSLSGGRAAAAAAAAASQPQHKRKRPALEQQSAGTSSKQQAQAAKKQDAAQPNQGRQGPGRHHQQQHQQQPWASMFSAPGMELPTMPTHPFPDPTDQAAIAAWYRGLAPYRSSIELWLSTVNASTDAAVACYQQAIDDLQAQRNSLQAEAGVYVQSLLLQGQQLLQSIQQHATGRPLPAMPQQQQQQQQPAAAHGSSAQRQHQLLLQSVAARGAGAGSSSKDYDQPLLHI